TQDLLASLEIGIANRDLTIEAARPQQRRVEDVGAIGGRDHDDSVGAREAVHLDEQLIQRLFALFMRDRVAAAVPADGIELVDEDDAARMTSGLAKQLADARSAD